MPLKIEADDILILFYFSEKKKKKIQIDFGPKAFLVDTH